MSLNSDYFELAGSKTNDNMTYECVKPKGNPMILFSQKDGSPLFSIHLKPKEQDVKSVIAERLDNENKEIQKFQGMINKDDQKFAIVVTNLSSDGCCSFQLFKTNKDATATSNYSINEINSLRANETVEIDADKSAGSKAMILKTITTKDGVKVSLQESEKPERKEEFNNKSTYFYITVTPENIPKLKEKYQSTVWKCVDYFIRSVEVIEQPQSMGALLVGGGPGFAGDLNIGGDGTLTLEGGVGIGQRLHIENDNIVGFHQKTGALVIHGGIACSKSLYNGDNPNELKNSDQRRSIDDGSLVTYGGVACSKDTYIGGNTNILESKASEIKQGEEIKVNAVEQFIDLDYSLQSQKCILGLSVQEDLEFVEVVETEATIKEEKEQTEKCIELFINKKYEEFLKKKSYDSVECCVCMEGAPDTIHYQCGHKCCHHECGKDLVTCPICRSRIKAKLKI